MTFTDVGMPEKNPLESFAPNARGGIRSGVGMGPEPQEPPSAALPEADPGVQQEGAMSGPPPPAPLQQEAEVAPQPGQMDPNDSRFADPGWVIMADIIMAGTLPWAMASADVATGRIESADFDNFREQYQRRLDDLKAQSPEFVSAAEKAAPMITGIATSIIKPAATAMGTIGRGAAVGATYGGIKGYTEVDPSTPSLDSDRLASAAGGVVEGGVKGAAGAAIGVGVSKGVQKFQAGRAAKVEGDKKFADAESKSYRQNKAAREKSHEDQYKRDVKDFTDKASKSGRKPDLPIEGWQANRKDFLADPAKYFRKQAELGADLDSFAANVNMSPISVVNAVKRVGVPEGATAAEKNLVEDFKGLLRMRGTAKEILSEGKTKAAAPKKAAAKPKAKK